MSQKKNIRTLFARKGSLWLDEEIPELPTKILDRLKDVNELYEFVARRRSILIGKGRPQQSTEHEEIARLQQRMEIVEEKLSEISQSFEKSKLDEIMNNAMNCFIAQVASLKANKVYYRKKERNLDFFLFADPISGNLLQKASSIEIRLSRKFPNLSICIQPVSCEDDIPENSHILR